VEKNDNILIMNKFIILLLLLSAPSQAQWNPKENKVGKPLPEVLAAVEKFKETPDLKIFFENAYGYAVFPVIKKGGFGIGGAGGNGQVFVKEEMIGNSKVRQVSIGLQAGGQKYREIIFFKDKFAIDEFTTGNFKLGAQASAVALTEGVSKAAAYNNGVAIFTQTIGGLMYEASVGGQKFSFSPTQ